MNNITFKYVDSLISNIEHLSKKIKLLLVFFMYAIFFFLLLLYRYTNQSYELNNISFNNLSNILNIIHFLVLSGILILCYVRLRNIPENDTTTIFFFSCFNVVLLPISQTLPDPYANALSVIIFFSLILFCVYAAFTACMVRKKKFLKSILTTFVLSLFIISLITIYVLSYVPGNYDLQSSSITHDSAVIFGAAVWQKNKPSPVLRERILKALSLYRSNKVNMFVVTGGNARGEITEAEAAKLFLMDKGIEESRIIVENKTSSTSEQVRYIRDSLYIKRNFKNLILVSDNFHLRRITEICKFNGINPIGVSSDSPLLEENIAFYAMRESIGLILFWYFGL